MANVEPALTIGILFSDGLIREEGTRKNTFIGTFQAFNLVKFPSQVPPFFVTPLLTNLTPDLKQMDVTVRIENPQNSVVLVSASSHVDFNGAPNRNETFEIPMVVFGLAFQIPGEYRVTVLVNNELIGGRPLFVRDARSPSISQ
jgi:hypothetical protein